MYCCYRFCCTIVTIFVVLLLPLLLHCDYRFCCISNFLLHIFGRHFFSIVCLDKSCHFLHRHKNKALRTNFLVKSGIFVGAEKYFFIVFAMNFMTAKIYRQRVE